MKILPNQQLIENAPARKADALVVRHAYKSFGNNHVLNDFNLELKRGESVVVLGKSGSGKSVLIKCIIGLLKLDSGDIELLGTHISDADETVIDAIRAKVGFLFQSNALYDSMTIRQNLEFPLRRHSVRFTQEQIDNRVLSALEDVGLAQYPDRRKG